MERIIEVLREAVLAGNAAIQDTRTGMMLRHKGYKEIVTNCDIASENAITDVLIREYTNCAVYSEEVGSISGTEELLFIIDPIDGTHNFIHHVPYYAISVGVYARGSPFAGMIFLPEFNHCFYAVKGQGAYLNDGPIRASSVLKLSEAMVAYDNQFHKHQAALRNMPLLAEKCFTLRIFGSACVDICNVACGVIDARIFHNTKVVDFAAGISIVEEAGGRVTDFSGKPVTPQTGDVIVSNERIHSELVALLEL